jgi:hypothetical protein
MAKPRSHSFQPAARMSQLYDVMNKLTVDLEVDSHAIVKEYGAQASGACAGERPAHL